MTIQNLAHARIRTDFLPALAFLLEILDMILISREQSVCHHSIHSTKAAKLELSPSTHTTKETTIIQRLH